MTARFNRTALLFFLITGIIHFTLTAQFSGPKTVFWEISGNGLSHTSYLFGTVHILPKKDFVMYSEVERRLKDAGQLVMEMDLNISLGRKLEMASAIMLPDNSTLQAYMDVKEYEKLKSYVLDSLGIKPFRFNLYEKMKPFAFYSALIPEIIGEKTASYEMYFNKIAKKKKIPVEGLETVEYQLGIFDSISIDKQIEMFFDFSEDPKKALRETLDLYGCHDIYKLAAIIKEDSRSEQLENELITVRNQEWIIKLATLMDNKPSFIAVGAGHLAGEHGLIHLLEEEGYILKPILLVECD